MFKMSIDRIHGIKCLSTILTIPKNCEIIEKHIYKAVENIDEEHKKENYTWYMYQVIGDIMKNPQNMKIIATDLKKGNVGWKNSFYNTIESKIQEHDDYIVKPFEVVDGVVKCPKCQNSKTWSVQKQTRSSDEPMTTFSRCVTCGHQWSYSG